MYTNEFDARLARVRHRFATTLESKIIEAVVSADRMSRGHTEIKYVLDSYRHLHNICGIGPTVGFVATGDAARAAEGALLRAYREKRAMTEAEVLGLKKALHQLRLAAASELQWMHKRAL
jgi:hypothetical protein